MFNWWNDSSLLFPTWHSAIYVHVDCLFVTYVNFSLSLRLTSLNFPFWTVHGLRDRPHEYLSPPTWYTLLSVWLKTCNVSQLDHLLIQNLSSEKDIDWHLLVCVIFIFIFQPWLHMECFAQLVETGTTQVVCQVQVVWDKIKVDKYLALVSSLIAQKCFQMCFLHQLANFVRECGYWMG